MRVLFIRNALETLKLFHGEVNNIRIGVNFTPLRAKYANLVSSYDEKLRDVHDLRLSLEDHLLDVKSRAKKDGRKVKRDKEKVRSQYYTGNVPKALAYEIVALSSQYGQSAGKFADDEESLKHLPLDTPCCQLVTPDT